MNAEQLIQTQREIAIQHFPGDSLEDRAARYAYQVGLLETKVRELLHRPILDLPVIHQGEAILPARVKVTA